MRALRCAPWAIALTVAIAACGNGDQIGSDDADSPLPASFAGFDSVPLVSGSAHGGSAPVGVFHYRVVSGSLDWYVEGSGYTAGRAYRVVLSARDDREYAVASRRARGDGSFAAHGVETMLMNRECVGTEDPSLRPLADALPIGVAVKEDGSPPGGSSGGQLLGSRGTLPCNGNGDGNFDYVMRATNPLPLSP